MRDSIDDSNIAIADHPEDETPIEGTAIESGDEAEPSVIADEAEVEEADAPSYDELIRKVRFLEGHERALLELKEDCDRAKDIWIAAKEDAAMAKKTYESRIEDLLKFVEESSEPNLFRESASVPRQPTFEGERDVDAWRECEIGVLELTPSLTQLLIEDDIDTLGMLSYRLKNYPELSTIKGIGPGKLEQILDAQARHAAENPELYPSVTSEAMDEAGESDDDETDMVDEAEESDESGDDDGTDWGDDDEAIEEMRNSEGTQDGI